MEKNKIQYLDALAYMLGYNTKNQIGSDQSSSLKSVSNRSCCCSESLLLLMEIKVEVSTASLGSLLIETFLVE